MKYFKYHLSCFVRNDEPDLRNVMSKFVLLRLFRVFILLTEPVLFFMCNEIIQAFLDLSTHFSRSILIEILTLM